MQARVPYNTTNSSYFTFTVTPPASDSTATIQWRLYYDDPWTTNNTLLDTYSQSVSSTVPRIISAYWWMPLDVSAGDEVTMCAEVRGITVGEQCTFKVSEDDPIDDDEILPHLTGRVYSGEEGKTYGKATWTSEWQDDGGLYPWPGDPEYFFEVS